MQCDTHFSWKAERNDEASGSFFPGQVSDARSLWCFDITDLGYM